MGVSLPLLSFESWGEREEEREREGRFLSASSSLLCWSPVVLKALLSVRERERERGVESIGG